MTSTPTRLATLVEILRQRALDEPTQQAFEWLGDDGLPSAQIDYVALDRRARAIAAGLQARGGAGERALLLYPPGLDFVAAVFGCLYAGWIAVPAYPPGLNERLARIESIVADATPLVALTTSATLARVHARLDVPLEWFATDDLASEVAETWRERSLDAEAIAILQYTSGSTSTPRGVMLSHANLVHNTRQIGARFEIDAASRGVIWLPPFHDMGLIGGILQGVQGGFPIALMSPLGFLQRPARWLEAISRTRATISGGPNFAYDLCVERLSAEDAAQLDLSSWQVAFNGAEPVRAETLERFSAKFAPCGFRREAFYPCYGLAEATLIVTGGAKSALPSIDGSAVGCGTSIDDQEVLIVDPETRRQCAQGEIWVAGPSVAAGYWRQPELTQETFHAVLEGDGRSFLRTGDLGVIKNGELFVTGRLKALIVVGGRKIHAEDVERSVSRSHLAGRAGCVVAVGVQDVGQERLLVVQEIDRRRAPADLSALVRAIRLQVADELQVPVDAVVLTAPRGVPRTSSGKVQRAACGEAFVAGRLPALYEWRRPISDSEGDATA